jgi:hypothetical protein
VDIILSRALAGAEAGLEEWEVTPAAARVETEEMEFSPTSPVWLLGTAVVERAGRGTELVVPVDWAEEETQGAILHVRDRTERLTLVAVAEGMEMPAARHRARADRAL